MWKPDKSRRHSDPLLGESKDFLSLSTHPRYLFTQDIHSHKPVLPDIKTSTRGPDASSHSELKSGGERELKKRHRHLKRSQSHDFDPKTKIISGRKSEKNASDELIINRGIHLQKQERKQVQKPALPPLEQDTKPRLTRSQSLGSRQIYPLSGRNKDDVIRGSKAKNMQWNG